MLSSTALDQATCDQFATVFAAAADAVESVVRGKRRAVHLALVAVFCEGHVLIEDVPGVGKTALAKAVAHAVGGTWRRVQCTPDLLPSDVTGVSVWDVARSDFEFRPGPVFANVVLADEINRASPRTQSALLEAMEERQVTVDGHTHPLPRPFIVLATQNPVELEGTHPLPEAQLDRFMFRLRLGYPDRTSELAILDAHAAGGLDSDRVLPVLAPSDVMQWARHLLQVHVAPDVAAYVIDIVDATRQRRDLRLGASTRAAITVQHAARVLAASLGRTYVLPDDVRAVVPHVLDHRLAPTAEARLRGVGSHDIVRAVLDSVPVPTRVHNRS